MPETLKIGVCADVHQDLIPDACKRLEAFIGEMNRERADFIIQLGDFCRPYDYNRPFMGIWDSFKGPSYHVLGNHDTDGGFKPGEVAAWWGARGIYYSFDFKGWHFIVLYGSEEKPGEKAAGYPHYIGGEQRRWLAEDLEKTDLPAILFCHQGADLDILEGLTEGAVIRRILERANEKAGAKKVRLFLSGHHHRDWHNVINGIHYVQINSMSYQWLGKDHPLERFEPEVYEKYPLYKYMVPYRDPLWAVMTIGGDGSIAIKGRGSEFIGPSPEEMGIGSWDEAYPTVPRISDRNIQGVAYGGR